MHKWGDKDVDWNGIDDAAKFIHDYCMRWSGLSGPYKEKFGTVRFYARFGYLGQLNNFGLAERLSNCPIVPAWQKKVYRKAYKLAIQEWPHLKQEILCCADEPDLLKGL